MSEVRNDLQATRDAYQQKLDEQREEQEKELSRVKEQNKRDVTKERESGSAAVNHIREETKQKLESLRNTGESRISNERGTYDRRLKDTQKQKEAEVGSIQESIENKKETAARETSAIQHHTSQAIDQEQNRMHDFERQEESRRSEMVRQNQEAINKSRTALASERDKIDSNFRNEVHKMNDEHVKTVEELKKEHATTLARQSAQDEAHLHEERDRSAKTIETEQKQFTQRTEQNRTRANAAIHEEAEAAVKRQNEQESRNQKDFDKERVRGSAAIEKTRAYYAGTEARLHKEGDEAIGSQKELNEQNLRTQDQKFKGEREERLQKFEAERKKAFDIYRTQEQHDDVFYRKSLGQQKEEFDRIFLKNSEMNKDVLEDSRERLTTELIKQKEKVSHSLGKYADKSEDPFYQMKSVDYHLNEHEGMYELRAQIPEKEKDNVKVIVKDNKVVLQGQKRYQDKVADHEHALATENFQSFREEIPLTHPVLDRFVTSEWSNGVLTLKIPKA